MYDEANLKSFRFIEHAFLTRFSCHSTVSLKAGLCGFLWDLTCATGRWTAVAEQSTETLIALVFTDA